METQLQLIREQQKESWNKIAAGWDKWDSMTMDFLQSMGYEIIRMIKPGGKDIVLDVAAGTGEPGLTIVAMLDGGKVYIPRLLKRWWIYPVKMPSTGAY